MGFIRDIFEDIKKQKEEEKEIDFDDLRIEYKRTRKEEFMNALYSDYGFTREYLIEKYEDLLNEDYFIRNCLADGNWKILDLLGDKEKEREIEIYSKWVTTIRGGAKEGRCEEIVVDYEEAIKHFPQHIFEDKDFIKLNSYNFPNIITKVPREVWRDSDLLSELLRIDKTFKPTMEIIGDELMKDNELLIEILTKEPSISKKMHISEELKEDLYYINLFLTASKDILNSQSDLRFDYIDKYPNILNFEEPIKEKNKFFVKNFKELLKEDKEFCFKVIDRGFLEHYSSMGEFKRDPDILNAIVDKFQEFDVSNDYDIERIAQYPSKLKETFDGINFSNERKLLEEKVELNFDK